MLLKLEKSFKHFSSLGRRHLDAANDRDRVCCSPRARPLLVDRAPIFFRGYDPAVRPGRRMDAIASTRLCVFARMIASHDFEPGAKDVSSFRGHSGAPAGTGNVRSGVSDAVQAPSSARTSIGVAKTLRSAPAIAERGRRAACAPVRLQHGGSDRDRLDAARPPSGQAGKYRGPARYHIIDQGDSRPSTAAACGDRRRVASSGPVS